MGEVVRIDCRQELTEAQDRVFTAICAYAAENQCPPTYSEIAGIMGYRSPNAAFGHVEALRRKGWVTLRKGTSRSIRVVIYEDEVEREEGAA